MWATFNRFEIEMTKRQAESASHPGPCDNDVEILLQDRKIKRQLAKIPDKKLAEELKEYGAWSDEELENRKENEARIIWLAAGNIIEELYEKKRGQNHE